MTAILNFFSHSLKQTPPAGDSPGQAAGQRGGDLPGGQPGRRQDHHPGYCPRLGRASDQVSSPTYVIVNEHGRPDGQTLFHVDAYRLNNTPLEFLDFDRMLSQGSVVIEWGGAHQKCPARSPFMDFPDG